MAKKKDKELLLLEDNDVGDVGESDDAKNDNPVEKKKSVDAVNEEEPITKPKRQLTEKQLEALKKGQQKRDENRERNRLEKQKREEEERKITEEKLIKKAIAIKKKQIKKQAILDEISDDDTPIQKIKKIAEKSQPEPVAVEPEKPKGPIIRFV